MPFHPETLVKARPRSHSPRLLFISAFALAILGLALLVTLALQSQRSLADYRSTQLDNSTWLFAQLEVDHLNLRRSVTDAIMAANGRSDYQPEPHFFTSFDIFYSRVQVLAARIAILEEFQELSPEFRRAWQQIETELLQLVGIYDGTEVWDAETLAELLVCLDRQAEAVRQVIVLALRNITTASAEMFDQNVQLTLYFVTSAIVMVLVLGIMVAISGRLASRVSDHSKRLGRLTTTLQRTFNASHDAIVLVDSLGLIVSCNTAAEKVFGWSRRELIGGSACEFLVPGRFSDSCAAELGRAASLSPTSFVDRGPVRLVCLRKDGSEFIAELVSVAETDSEDNRFLVCFIRDVSKQTQTEQLLRDAKLEAERVARNKARFLAVVSHELRTPLHGIAASIELMPDWVLQDDETQDLIRTARTSSVTALEILDEVLSAFEIESDASRNKSEVFVPADLAAEIVMQNRSVAFLSNTTISLQNDWTRSTRIAANRKAFRHALANLCRNATKFTQNGEVIVRLLESPTQPGNMRVEVEDTGIGIAPEDLERVFEDFETAERIPVANISGTGLGLGIVKRAIEALDGTVGVTSQKGWGSLFWFEFPVQAAPDDPREPDMPGCPSRVSTSLRVLVVDDNDINRHVMSRMLQRLGHEVETAADGESAVACVATTRFDVVFMDLNMPGMNGYEASCRIHSENPGSSIKIIAVTANTESGLADFVLRKGFHRLILKPFTKNDLKETLDEIGMTEAAVQVVHPGSELFDPSGVADFIDALGQDLALQTTQRAFLEAEASLSALDEAAQPGQHHRRAIHSAAGALGFVGAIACSKAFQALEDALKTSDEAMIAAARAESEAILQQSRNAL